jgi:lipopolysaccharide/colanic/teichoic acid biosynthesis glycosyltransferase
MAIWMNSWSRIYDRSNPMKKISQLLFTRENLLALLLCLILIALVIFTTDTSPTWIYQGF